MICREMPHFMFSYKTPPVKRGLLSGAHRSLGPCCLIVLSRSSDSETVYSFPKVQYHL